MKIAVASGVIAVTAVTAVGLIYTLGFEGSEDLRLASTVSSWPPEKLRFAEHDLVLQSVEGVCAIDYRVADGDERLNLGISPPCRFMRPDDGPLKIYREDGAQVFAVVGGTLEYDSLDPLITSRADCGDQIAGIVYTDGMFRLVYQHLGPGKYCAFMGLDQKDFWLFLHG